MDGHPWLAHDGLELGADMLLANPVAPEDRAELAYRLVSEQVDQWTQHAAIEIMRKQVPDLLDLLDGQ